MVASPELVSEIRESPGLLRDRYELSDREWRRLVSIANQPGMKCNNMLYRANRLTPVAVYLPGLCDVLADDLQPLLAEYWTAYPHTNLNFLLESYRFCQFVQDKLDDGSLPAGMLPVLKQEKARVSQQIKDVFCSDADGDIAAVFAGAGVEIDLSNF